MQKQSGNFLLQALLALTLIFAFMPFFASRISSRDMAAQMYAATEQIETAYGAARIFLREERNNLPYKKQELSHDKFVRVLEYYGLPLGFVPKTHFNQNISLVIEKNENGVYGFLNITGGNLSKVQLAELARRIGFYASINGDNIEVDIPFDVKYTDIVSKTETDENVGFLSELDMADNNIDGIEVLFARNGEFESAQFNTLALFGVEQNKKDKNKISDLYANKTIFQTADGGSAFALSKGDINTESASLRTVSRFGTAGGFESNVASVYEFSMTEGRTSFSGPGKWSVHGSIRADNFSFTVDRLDIDSFLDVSRGQDVFVNANSYQYSTKTGVDVKNIYASNISLRDQTSNALLDGYSGVLLVDIRPAGTSVFPDVYTDEINNDKFEIIDNPKDTTGKMVSCKDIINAIDVTYSSKSLAQNIICQYVFWQRLESRINLKQCLQSGQSDCMGKVF